MDCSPKNTLENKSAAESHQRTPANLEALLLLYVYTDSRMKEETSKETSDIDQRWRRGEWWGEERPGEGGSGRRLDDWLKNEKKWTSGAEGEKKKEDI